MNSTFDYRCESLASCQTLANKLSQVIPTPFAIRLDGTLGAGKTQFIKFLAMALGASAEDVTSPTFVLVHRYPTLPTIFHLDAYRVRDEDEFLELGVEEYFEEPALTLIEWGEKFVDVLPRDHLAIHIEVDSESSRRFRFKAAGPRGDAVVHALQSTLGDHVAQG